MFTFMDYLVQREYVAERLSRAAQERLARMELAYRAAQKAEKRRAKRQKDQTQAAEAHCCTNATA